jgi:transcription elongation factor Elf1
MSAAPTPKQPPALHYDIVAVCRDCGAQFLLEEPAVSEELYPSGNGVRVQYVVLRLRYDCPVCHNIRAVRTQRGCGEKSP